MMGAEDDSIEPINDRLASILSLLEKFNSTDTDKSAFGMKALSIYDDSHDIGARPDLS